MTRQFFNLLLPLLRPQGKFDNGKVANDVLRPVLLEKPPFISVKTGRSVTLFAAHLRYRHKCGLKGKPKAPTKALFLVALNCVFARFQKSTAMVEWPA